MFRTSANDTIYFGGTVWAADSSRWEALMDSTWTFNSGVGSHFDHSAPGVDPFKDPSLHASMEGWVGIDRTYYPIPYFRRMAKSQFGSGQNDCSLNGEYVFWAGVLPSEAALLCYAAGGGYGNNWNVCIEHDFAYTSGNVALSYVYANDTELEFDYTYVRVDTGGVGEVTVASHTDVVSGTNFLNLIPGTSLPSSPGTIKIRFCVVTDGAYSDEDGDYTTSCGAFSLDDVSVTGGGINHFADFETSDNGWTLSPAPAGPGGDWSDIVHIADLPPPLVDCACDLGDSVLVFDDIYTPGHGLFQDNLALSPWIDLKAANLVGAPGKFVEASIYAYLPGLNYVYAQVLVQWYPYTCLASGKKIVSPLTGLGQTLYFGSQPVCNSPGAAPYRFDFSSKIDAGAEQIRIALGVFSSCLFFPNCTGLSNTSPWYDNVRLGVWKTAAGAATPVLSAGDWDLPQDAFPTDGSLNLSSTARVDAGIVKGALEPAPGTALGDTLVVSGGSGGAEVYVQFAVRPGPGTDPGGMAAFLSRATFQETRRGLDWYAARMDTAEQGGLPDPGYWMTTYHESDPGFVGSDTDPDPNDLDPQGGMTHLANDIFPDDLFTAGTRINLFYKTRFTAASAWFTLPDTSLATYEMEVLPSSMDSTGTFNCLLYVDHAGGTHAQGIIEGGLAQVLPATSANFEQTGWDRYDVQAPSSHQAPLGRPYGTEYGASVQQMNGYRQVIWNSGILSAFNLVQEDADVLIPWMTGSGTQGLYLSGDDLAMSMTAEGAGDPGAQALLEDFAGVLLTCGTYRDADCPPGSPLDDTVCLDLDPVGGAAVALRPLGGTPQAQGNGCPYSRSFDVLEVNGSALNGNPIGDEQYATAVKTANYASVASADTVQTYRMVTDGVSLHLRRDAGYCAFTGSVHPLAVEERLQEVLDWFGTPGNACKDPSSQIGVGDDGTLPVRTTLAGMVPNPLLGGDTGRITFTLAHEGHARLDVFDLQGRLVRTIADGRFPEGTQSLRWDGRDEGGRPVGSGVYFFRLAAAGSVHTRKGVIIQTHR